MSRSKFKIHLPASGSGEDALVEIDGRDITDQVSFVEVRGGVSDLTRVVLTFPAVDVEIEGEGAIE